MTVRSSLALAIAGALAACSTAGPDYRPPERSAATAASATAAFAAGDDHAFVQAPLPDRWWQLYEDPMLDRLVEQALAANSDLRAADANLRRATAVVQEAAAGRTIATMASGGVDLARPSGTGQGLPGTVGYDLGLSATYPLDLNGKIRRAIEAAQADAEAVQAARDAVRVSVAAATARAYVGVCAANYGLSVNREVTALQRRTLDATRKLQRGGRGTAFDVSRAQTVVDESEATLPGFEARRQADLFLLATLLGRPPADYPREVAACASLPFMTKPLPIGDGAGLIRRRPDIRAAERSLAADTARIGVAMADLYPQVSFGGSLGLAGPLDNLGSGSAFGFSVGPLLSWSFPNRAAVKAQIAQAGAQVDADLASFDTVVLGALREAETALSTYARDRDKVTALTQARDSAALSAGQAEKLFRFGRSGFFDLLDAQRSLATAEASVVAARTQLALDEVDIFLALGGGWQDRP
ncbi:efflux transporter, outer membrane factor (OMF) lipoprotein, NodT family [Sphingomonas laterariae]|uniref:Efflux transporter, outer membrane factor (OMF) lipoprotein, NodT family n=1 Tax=Edaphosphingomonas laterariae TaxID=861865 RepID=A0A239JH04_9SPHN|nr:TolC family protein [Sphingomonas laterariae]SNT04573.1 efflux transporter, outer membrane factor (OMF) lipoprotein, NodT family [Sphingomonas laterariae]